jgi:glutamate formiminotransferase
MKLIECVPNFSEGRRPEVVAAIRDAIAAVPGAYLLDASSDASHNRSVITFVASIDVVVEAAFAGIREAQRLIDLTSHAG